VCVRVRACCIKPWILVPAGLFSRQGYIPGKPWIYNNHAKPTNNSHLKHYMSWGFGGLKTSSCIVYVYTTGKHTDL
jgi:hypothetical protein